MIFISHDYRDTGIFPATAKRMNWPERGRTIELCAEFFTLEIPLGTCRLIIDNAIVDPVSSRQAALDKGGFE